MPQSVFDTIWNLHRIARSDEGLDLLFVDRNYLHDLSGTIGLEEMSVERRPIRQRGLNLAAPDHVIATEPDGAPGDSPQQKRFVQTLQRLSEDTGIRHFARGSGDQGIAHVVGLERGFTLPGLTVVCADSHTSTHGSMGALAWGIGQTETRHVLATQTLWMKKPRQARIWLEGTLAEGIYAKDLILWLIGKLGADYGREHCVEFAGPVIEQLSIEARATICNLGVEMGARFVIVAPDQKTFDYLQGRRFVPQGELWEKALTHWKTLQTDPDAIFDKEERFDVSQIAPQITWGVSPEQVTSVDGRVPAIVDTKVREYIGLSPQQTLPGVPIDYVFIGSCANSRLEDLQIAAHIVRGHKVASGITAWIVPGSELVRQQAEAEGLDQVFLDAGFSWRQPGCSMCVAVNGDVVPPGKRCISTSNRNFIGRQGPNSRTHLASPATAAASAITGVITDPRGWLSRKSED